MANAKIRYRSELKSGHRASPSRICHRPGVSSAVKTLELVKCKAPAFESEVRAMQATQDAGEYRILLPLVGVDPRNVYVRAAARSLLVEVRSRKRVRYPHDEPFDFRLEDCCVSCEFKLRNPIRQGGTLIEAVGNSLHITAIKSPNLEETSWSELVQFDTRASLGRV